MPSLTSLAEQMLAQAKVIDGYLEQKNIPYTSLNEDTLESLPEYVQNVRSELLDTSHIFKQLVRGPTHSGLDFAYNVSAASDHRQRHHSSDLCFLFLLKTSGLNSLFSALSCGITLLPPYPSTAARPVRRLQWLLDS